MQQPAYFAAARRGWEAASLAFLRLPAPPGKNAHVKCLLSDWFHMTLATSTIPPPRLPPPRLSRSWCRCWVCGQAVMAPDSPLRRHLDTGIRIRPLTHMSAPSQRWRSVRSCIRDCWRKASSRAHLRIHRRGVAGCPGTYARRALGEDLLVIAAQAGLRWCLPHVEVRGVARGRHAAAGWKLSRRHMDTRGVHTQREANSVPQTPTPPLGMERRGACFSLAFPSFGGSVSRFAKGFRFARGRQRAKKERIFDQGGRP